MELSYTQVGDYLLPNIRLSESRSAKRVWVSSPTSRQANTPN